jgi:hypothetical protein
VFHLRPHLAHLAVVLSLQNVHLFLKNINFLVFLVDCQLKLAEALLGDLVLFLQTFKEVSCFFFYMMDLFVTLDGIVKLFTPFMFFMAVTLNLNLNLNLVFTL